MIRKVCPTVEQIAAEVQRMLMTDTLTTLLLAVTTQNDEVVERVLRSLQVNVDARNEFGACGLHIAALKGFTSTCRILVRFGAEVDSLWEGSTPLHLAASEGRSLTVAFLVGQGADMALKDSSGFAPLHLAAIRNNRVLASYFIQLGADPQQRDGDGLTVSERWNLNAVHPSVRHEHPIDNNDAVTTRMNELHPEVSSSALLERFKTFLTFKEVKSVVAVTPTFHEMHYERTVSTREIRDYFEKNVDAMGLPHTVVQKKIDNLFAACRKNNMNNASSVAQLQFEDFCFIWVKAQADGLM